MLEFISKLNPRQRTAFDSGIILFFSILVCVPIILNGIPATQDVPQQFQFAQNFYNSVANGIYYPGWADQPNLGYGDVSVRFYPPLTYYILSFFRLLTGNWFDASILFFISLYFLSGLGVYKFCKQYFNASASLFAGIIYIWLPYHVLQIYLGGVFAEFTAAAILPFCLLFINRVCEKGRLIDICGLAFTYALILLTNLPLAVISSLTFLGYAIFSLRKTFLIQNILKLGASVLISLSLSSFYLVRMISEIDFVKHSGEAFSSGNYSYKTQFIFSYFFPFLDIHHASATAGFNLISVITLGLSLPGLIFIYRNKISSLKNIIFITFFGLFMAMPLSLMVWEILTPLQKIQFPYRWLTIFTLGAAILSAASFSFVCEYLKTSKRYIAFSFFGLVFICFVYNYNYLMSSDITFPRSFLLTITERFKTMPSYECWWTTWAQKSQNFPNRPAFLADKIEINNRSFEIKKWTPTERFFIISEGEAGVAVVATLYYPHWKATINSQPVAVTTSQTGLISIPVSEKTSEIHLSFQEPAFVVNVFYISGAMWIIFLFLLFYSARKSSAHNS